ncbi:MAG: hypothetical protein GWO04_19530, partial [Actinobacteria bacterium]|nr:hypothetical protein [Actinomycetota bacterium]NIS32006.1 hypothetical protein [Actinomycetota bacterium]
MAEVGADATGGRSVVQHILEHAGDDTLLEFPPGRYRMDGPVSLPSFSNLGIVGQRATIVPSEGYTGVLFNLGDPE